MWELMKWDLYHQVTINVNSRASKTPCTWRVVLMCLTNVTLRALSVSILYLRSSLIPDQWIRVVLDFIFGGGEAFFDSCQIGLRHNPNGAQMYVLIPAPDVSRSSSSIHKFLSSGWLCQYIYVQSVTANRGGPEYPNSLFVIHRPSWVELEGVQKGTTYFGRAWASKPHVCVQYADGPPSLNPLGWDPNSIGKVPFDGSGFEEWPSKTGSASHVAPKEYTKSDVL